MRPDEPPHHIEIEKNAITITEGDVYYSFSDAFDGNADLPPIRRSSYVARLRALADLLERGPR